MSSLICNPLNPVKPIAVISTAFAFLAISVHGAMAPDWWSTVSIPIDITSIETAIWKSAEQRVEERNAAKAKHYRKYDGCCSADSSGIIPLTVPPVPSFDSFIKLPNNLIELLGGETNFKLVYGTDHVEFFKLDAAQNITAEVPYDFPKPKDAWNLQSLLTLDATYAWGDVDEEELVDFPDETPPPPDYRIKFHENGKTVSVDISLRERHVRVIADGANEYGAFLSDFGYENLKQGISFIYPRALLD